ncbi:hypothetical protein [Cryobacterium sp. 5B3]|uniref:hypothetical protein n=1 Tax=Cryobacterium sp. 5B3 TaxID=3048586 RepID=UPI002AB3ADD5|nr:hypothetical protein [Cryobacterium sp. 5B3]MDY7542414.1 hypothetical protein [Cryobacterium sp. 5B3]MEB0275042.1 hypothetical protein [Cryobacterium sp. 5B3]
MNRGPSFALASLVLAVLALSACSSTPGVVATPTVAGGAIELAVSQTCAASSDLHCVAVNGENVVLPSAFERAGVGDAVVAEGEGRNAVDVTFSEEGSVVFRALTEKAVGAGSTARLVMRIGGELKAAVVVMQAMEGDQVQIGLSPDDNAQGVVDLIRRG